jgi:hypothetical protein
MPLMLHLGYFGLAPGIGGFVLMRSRLNDGGDDSEHPVPPLPPLTEADPLETTRFAIASLFLGGPFFRRGLRSRLEPSLKARAPELGLDTELLVRMHDFVEGRNLRYAVLGTLALIPIGVALATTNFAITWLSFFLGIAIYAHKAERERNRFLPLLDRDDYSPEVLVEECALPKLRRDLHFPLGLAPHENVIVYSGYVPFPGFGVPVGSSSFTVDLERPAEDAHRALREKRASDAPKKVTLEEVYAALREELGTVPCAHMEERKLMTIQGRQLGVGSSLLPEPYEPPIQAVNLEEDDQNLWVPSQGGRWYRTHTFYTWDGDVAITYCVRAGIVGTGLLIDVVRMLLAPLAPSHRGIDRRPREHWVSDLEFFGRCIVIGGFYPAIAGLSVLGRMTEGVRDLFGGELRSQRGEARRDRGFDYGAPASIREGMATGNFERYVQRADVEVIMHAAEQRVMDALVDLLDDKGVDTSALRERQLAILNTGIIGDVKARAVSVGVQSSAQVETSRLRRSSNK